MQLHKHNYINYRFNLKSDIEKSQTSGCKYIVLPVAADTETYLNSFDPLGF